jgi:sorbose reductase
MLTKVFLGGGRGIGLALAYAVAQAGSNVAVLDSLTEPHADFTQLKEFGVKAEYFRSVYYYPGYNIY